MVKVAVVLPAGGASAGEWLADAQAMEAAGAEALLVATDGEGRAALLGALAALTARSRIDVREAPAAVRWLARGREIDADELAGWRTIPRPDSREHWQALHAAAESDGCPGVIVELCAPLLDLLRNPDVVEDRSDLRLAQG